MTNNFWLPETRLNIYYETPVGNIKVLEFSDHNLRHTHCTPKGVLSKKLCRKISKTNCSCLGPDICVNEMEKLGAWLQKLFTVLTQAWIMYSCTCVRHGFALNGDASGRLAPEAVHCLTLGNNTTCTSTCMGGNNSTLSF